MSAQIEGIEMSSDGGRWEHFPHGADIGVRGLGASLAQAFAEAARAMTAAVVELDTVRPEMAVEIRCAGASAEDLLYAWLNAVIFEMSVRRMVFGRFRVEIKGYDLHATAWGERVSVERHQPAVEIKGATFTALSVRREDDKWVAQCVIDV